MRTEIEPSYRQEKSFQKAMGIDKHDYGFGDGEDGEGCKWCGKGKGFCAPFFYHPEGEELN